MADTIGFLVEKVYRINLVSFLEMSFLSELWTLNYEKLENNDLTESNLVKPKKMLVKFTYSRTVNEDIDQYRTTPVNLYNDNQEFAEELLLNEEYEEYTPYYESIIHYEDIQREDYVEDSYEINSVKYIQ